MKLSGLYESKKPIVRMKTHHRNFIEELLPAQEDEKTGTPEESLFFAEHPYECDRRLFEHCIIAIFCRRTF